MANLPPLEQWIPAAGPTPVDYVQRVLLWLEVQGYTVQEDYELEGNDWWEEFLSEFELELQFLGAGFYSAAFEMPDGRVLKIGFKGERDAGKDYARWCRANQSRLHVPRVHDLATVNDSIWYMVTDMYLTYSEAQVRYEEQGQPHFPVEPKGYWLLASHVLEGGCPNDEYNAVLCAGCDQRPFLIETMADIRAYFAGTTFTDLHSGNILFQVAYREDMSMYLVPIINDPLSCSRSFGSAMSVDA
jgi:hypothetical protein